MIFHIYIYIHLNSVYIHVHIDTMYIYIFHDFKYKYIYIYIHTYLILHITVYIHILCNPASTHVRCLHGIGMVLAGAKKDATAASSLGRRLSAAAAKLPDARSGTVKQRAGGTMKWWGFHSHGITSISSIFMGFSIINYPFGRTPILATSKWWGELSD